MVEKHWGCSFAEIDRKAGGVGSTKLDYLLWARGWFHNTARCPAPEAALFLLTHPSARHRQTWPQRSARMRAPPTLGGPRRRQPRSKQRASLNARGYRRDNGEGNV
jgi:hypothetical protein